MTTLVERVLNTPSFLSWRHLFPVHLLTADERKTLDLVKDISQEKLLPRALEHFQTGIYPIASYQDLADASLLSLTIPKKYGGKKFSPLAFTAAMLEFGQDDPVVANTINMHYVVLWFLSKLATPAQKKYFFSYVTDYGELFAASTSEPGIQWDDPAGTMLYTTLSQLSNGNYVLNGEKWRTSMTHSASHYCVAAVLEGYSPKNGLVIAVVPNDTPGVTKHTDWPNLMMWSTDSCSIQFENCVIPARNVIGKPGQLPDSGLFALFALGYSAFYLGMGLSGFLAFKQDYAAEVSDEILGTMALKLNRALCLLGQAAVAWQNADHLTIPIATAHAKAYCPEAAYSVLEQINALVDKEQNPYHRLLVDAQAAKYMPPSPKLVATRFGQAIKLGIEPKFLGFRGD